MRFLFTIESSGFAFLLNLAVQGRLHTLLYKALPHPFNGSRTDIQRLVNRLIRPLTLSGVDISFQQNASVIDFVNWGFSLGS